MDSELSKAIVVVSKVKRLMAMVDWTDEELIGDDINRPLEAINEDLAKLETALKRRPN